MVRRDARAPRMRRPPGAALRASLRASRLGGRRARSRRAGGAERRPEPTATRCSPRASCGPRSTCAARAISPNTVGMRGSMPGDAKPRTGCTCASACEYRNRTSGHWATLSTGRVGVRVRRHRRLCAAGRAQLPADARRRAAGVHAARRRRIPVAARAPVLGSATRVTAAGHRSLAGRRPGRLQRCDVRRSAEQARIVRDDAVDAHAFELGDHPRVVHRPHVELAAALAHRAHERDV